MKKRLICFYFLLTVLVSSCAIHSDFPFICFRKECVQSQFKKSPKRSGGKRGLKQKVNTLAVKMKQKQVKRKSKKPDPPDRDYIGFSGFEGSTESSQDSIVRDTADVADYIKMIIYYKAEKPEKNIEKDSVYIKVSRSPQAKEDKALINYYLEKHPAQTIKQVQLIINAEKEEDSSVNSRSGLMKARRLENYMINGGVKEEIITIK
ncbi:MAG: hypothetical protein JST26_13720 [Bacteroidetes bacterium]|nr:hypothetical protein [Bacteroidota bacterium]